MEQIEIALFYHKIQMCNNIESLNNLYIQYSDKNHPQLYYKFGIKYFILGERDKAKLFLLKGAVFGIKYPCVYYDNDNIDAIGQCLGLLLTQFPLKRDISYLIKPTCLSYIFLSRCIELVNNRAYDSLRTRAILFKDHEIPQTVHYIISSRLSPSTYIEPFIISDFYFSSVDLMSPHNDLMEIANSIHRVLDDVFISGRHANEYSTFEIAELGRQRHNNLFKMLEVDYKRGLFDISVEELEGIFN